jgi:hypothetical protein
MHGHVAQPVELGPQRRHFAALPGESEGPTRAVERPALFQGDVVRGPHRTDPLPQQRRLFGRRIEAIDVGLVEQHDATILLAYADIK